MLLTALCDTILNETGLSKSFCSLRSGFHRVTYVPLSCSVFWHSLEHWK